MTTALAIVALESPAVQPSRPGTMHADNDDQQANIDRTVGISALRRMSKLAAEINQQERRTQTSARRLLAAVGILLLVLGVLAIIDLGLIPALLRWIV